jgi:Planctomycete cytochrome C/Cytochrome C oxidase, cbb3-type, subunit III
MNKSLKNVFGLRRLSFPGIAVALFVLVNSCMHDPFIDPFTLNEGQPTTPGCVSGGTVCFESSVLPIFLSSCARSGCHDAITREEGFVLDNYSNIVKKGIVPGNANESKLYKVLFAGGDDQMPPDAPLSQAQKDSIAAWINQGAKNTVNCNCSCDPTKFTYAAIVQPIITNQCVGCHKPGSLGGNIDLSSYSLVKVQVDNGKLLGSITHAVGYSPMPQGSKLSDCQITQIKNWISAGALNN